jgi:hypothetical protein
MGLGRGGEGRHAKTQSRKGLGGVAKFSEPLALAALRLGVTFALAW